MALAQQMGGYTCVNDSVVTSNTTWNTNKLILEDLTVDSLATLTITETLYVANNARIIVRPGGKLVVDGGTLTSACDGEMWQGIEVVGDRTKRQLPQWQGTVELKNGATVENALCGIRTGLAGNAGFATAGGIINATDATFRNNRRDVEFISYTNHTISGSVTDNVSRFTNCTFSVDDDNLFSQNSVSFIGHVSLWEVRGVRFLGCSFENATTGQGDRRYAIYSEDAGFTVDKICTEMTIDPNTCTCPGLYSDSCLFTGFTTAIDANTSGNERKPVEVDFAVFRNNGTAVRINGNHFATVTRSFFDQQDIPTTAQYNYGLVLDHCTGYKVEGNRFRKASKNPLTTSVGIHVISSGETNNSIYRNTFDTLDYGIRVFGTNGNWTGGLQMTAGTFRNNTYGIYIAFDANVSPSQGSIGKGADNLFSGTEAYGIYNAGSQHITYFHSPGYSPGNVTTSNISVIGSAAVNPRTSTLCVGGGVGPVNPPLLAGFQSGIGAFASAMAATADAGGTGDGTVGTSHGASLQARQTLSDTYYEAVRAIMADSVLDLGTLEQWHAAAQPIADPYSLTETRFMEGYAEPFIADAEDAELANYAEFHAMKVALRNNGNSVGANNYSPLQSDGHINWYALTPAQIAQLQTIAERNTGRASVMAKGVLCFFFGICYEDEWDDAGVCDTPQQDGGDTRAHTKRAAMRNDDGTLSIHPNPTSDLLYIELRGAEIANVALYDLQGRVVTGVCDTPQQGATATLNVESVPTGVYLLRVKDTDGKEYHRKIVKR